MSQPAPASGPRRNFRFAIRLRTMLLIVLVAALYLAYRDHRRRRAPVDELLSLAPMGVGVDLPTSPYTDSVIDRSGRFRDAVARVRLVGSQEAAVLELIEVLKVARGNNDTRSMTGALAGLRGMGPGIRLARADVARVVLDGGSPALANDPRGHARLLAIHMLGQIIREDDKIPAELITALTIRDQSESRVFTASIANELAAFGPEAKAATTGLIAILDQGRGVRGADYSMRRGRPDLDLAEVAVISALNSIGPAAREAVPTLVTRIRNPKEDPLLRRWALSAAAAILLPADPDRGIPEELTALLDGLANGDDDDDASGVRAMREQLAYHSEVKRRRARTKRMIASDRALLGRARPEPEVAIPPPPPLDRGSQP